MELGQDRSGTSGTSGEVWTRAWIIVHVKTI